jgi:transposase
MREKKYFQSQELSSRIFDIYRLRVVEGMNISDIIEKLGVSRSSIYRALSTFERENPQQAARMKREGKEIRPEEYTDLLKELSELKKALARERLRADFYQEMVAYGKEVYGIDLKKAGTK